MQFRIESTIWSKEEMLERYSQILTKYGIEKIDKPFKEKYRVKDKNGNIIIQEIAVRREHMYVNIETLDQLMSLVRELDRKQVVITAKDIEWTEEDTIEIYDGFRE